MAIRDQEFSPPEREEYPPPAPNAENPAPPGEQEFRQEAEEFPPVPAPASGEGGPRRRRRFLLYLGAALLLVWILRGGAARQAPPAPEAAPPAEATPAASAEPSPDPTPEPTPEITEVKAVFLSFSDTWEGAVTFTGQDKILSSTAEIRDAQIDQSIERFEIPREAIERGVWKMDTLEVYPVYTRFREAYEAADDAWPDPELIVTYRFLNENGDEEEASLTVPNSYELGWSARYAAPDADPEWTYPGCFVFSTYESMTPVALSYSRDEPAEPGAFTLWVTVDGRDVTPEEVQMLPRKDPFAAYEDEGPRYYYGNLVIPMPDWAPAHGTAHFTVRQRLLGFDEVWVTEVDVSF